MTIPTAGNTIYRQDMADRINTLISTWKPFISWTNTYNPFNTASDGSTTSGTYSSTSPAPPGLRATTDYTSSAVGDYGAANSTITASTIINIWVAYTSLMSSIRKIRVIKTYDTNGTNSDYYDQTKWAALGFATITITKPYDQNPKVGDLSSANKITASGLEATYVNLAAQISNNNSGVYNTYTEQWCHSNCHSNYSARGRR